MYSKYTAARLPLKRFRCMQIILKVMAFVLQLVVTLPTVESVYYTLYVKQLNARLCVVFLLLAKGF